MRTERLGFTVTELAQDRIGEDAESSQVRNRPAVKAEVALGSLQSSRTCGKAETPFQQFTQSQRPGQSSRRGDKGLEKPGPTHPGTRFVMT